jgi:hypothetical protein
MQSCPNSSFMPINFESARDTLMIVKAAGVNCGAQKPAEEITQSCSRRRACYRAGNAGQSMGRSRAT